MHDVRKILSDSKGQGITEYALILGLVVLGIWVAVNATGIGDEITSLFGRVATEVTECTSGDCGG